jgi:hypothetical protein
MLTFLFWNLNKKPLEKRVARLCAAHAVDVLIVAECAEPANVLSVLQAEVAETFHHPFADESKCHFFVRSTEMSVAEQFDEPYGSLSIRRLEHPNGLDLLVAAVHWPSKVNWDSDDHSLLAGIVANNIAATERAVGHQCTVLIGDFNANPFEPGIVGAPGIHGVMTTGLANRESRKVSGRDFPFFYNPMWGLFGDRTPGPPGTHYYGSGKPVNYFWNMYDQVLVRPSLVSALSEVRILDSDGTQSLLTRTGLPDTASGSDHLPVLLRLDFVEK